MDSGFGKVFVAATVIATLFLLSNVSLSSSIHADNEDKAGSFSPTNCTKDSDCTGLCHSGNFLFSRCDVNGTCICDCSDPNVVNSSYTSACSGRQPEGYWWDTCDTYCRQEYRRPCRYCTPDQTNHFCTCVCNYPAKANEEDHEHNYPK